MGKVVCERAEWITIQRNSRLILRLAWSVSNWSVWEAQRYDCVLTQGHTHRLGTGNQTALRRHYLCCHNLPFCLLGYLPLPLHHHHPLHHRPWFSLFSSYMKYVIEIAGRWWLPWGSGRSARLLLYFPAAVVEHAGLNKDLLWSAAGTLSSSPLSQTLCCCSLHV